MHPIVNKTSPYPSRIGTYINSELKKPGSAKLSMLVNGHNLSVEVNGPEDGPVVVLLHHGLGSVNAWRRQVTALAQAGYRTVAYDRWGYGDSDPRPSLDVPAFRRDLDDLLSLLIQLEAPKAALIGHSDGGTIALYFAVQYPERVSCLILVAGHIYLEPKMKTGILGIKRSFETDEGFRKGMQSAHGEKSASVFHNWFDGWKRVESLGWDMRSILGQVSCPALVVQGTEDEHATPRHAMDIAASIAGADLWLLSGAKHMLPQENYLEFNPRVLQFLQAHLPAGH